MNSKMAPPGTTPPVSVVDAPSGAITEAFPALDRAWSAINVLGGANTGTDLSRGYNLAIDEALAALEALGATDAHWRATW